MHHQPFAFPFSETENSSRSGTSTILPSPSVHSSHHIPLLCSRVLAFFDMDRNLSPRRPQKRPTDAGDDRDRLNKKALVKLEEDDSIVGVLERNVYKFRVLLPTGMSIGVTVRNPNTFMTIQQFMGKFKEEYFRETEVSRPRRGVNWSNPELFLVTDSDEQLRKHIDFKKFRPNKIHILRLDDGSKAANMYKNMWDLTPDTELLKELPEEYTSVTALADLIDNSLQAVWSQRENQRRFISIEVTKDKISIFDTGPGMDDSEENSIVKWGKIGASLHRSSRGKAIGGKPPYLTPVFGMFGYGGPIASMHLGRHAEVSSKTKESKKVYLLHLEREALLNHSGSKRTWTTDGNLRDPLDEEIERSPHGSFTKVDIFELKMRSLGISQLQCKLKDIYFPYIQCDELSKTGRTITPIEFQVNGTDLAEVDGGEVAIANLHSCNGPEFVLQLCFSFNQGSAPTSSPGARTSLEANARLKCVYFPVTQGKENIESILEKLEDQEYGITENYESFSRVSVRRLDTDAGFNPTPSKTDLAHQNLYTTALKNFGNKQPADKERDLQVEIKRDGNPLTLLQLDKQYQDWIIQMHERYDEEVNSGVDDPIIIVGPSNMKELRISINVVRVHRILRRKGTSWKSGQKIKILKGACAGVHKNNVYATLEFFLLEGFQGDAGGEARLICRPMNIPEENGCLLDTTIENPNLRLQKSITLPISVIDSGKCLVMENADWNILLEKQNQKSPSLIEILSARHCQQLGIEVALPVEDVVDAGHVPPEEIVAVVRPASYASGTASNNLDQKYIVKDNFEMALEVKFKADDRSLHDEDHKYSAREIPSSRGGVHGLYIFQLKCKSSPLFQKAGVYTFLFSLRESSCRKLVKKVQVTGLSEVQRWGILRSEKVLHHSVRVGSCFPPVEIACYDKYDNQTRFINVPEIVVKIYSNRGTLAEIDKMNVSISSNELVLCVKDIHIESSELDSIRPCYEATLIIGQRQGVFSVDIPFKVYPGSLKHVALQPVNFEMQLLPGHVIKELTLELFDAFGNHMRKDEEIHVKVDGFCFQDKKASACEVDNQGCIDLSNLLKVKNGYGKTASLSVLSGTKEIFRKEFQIEKRELRIASAIPTNCAAGSQLENIVFEVVNSKGDVDESIHDEEKFGRAHTLTLKSELMDIDDSIKYSFRHGRCTVRTISIPRKEGKASLVASHSRHPELQLTLTIEVHVEPETEMDQHNIQPGLILPGSPVFKTSKDDPHQSLDGKALLLLDPSPVKTEFDSIKNDKKELEDDKYCLKCKELEDDICAYGLSIGEHEAVLDQLLGQQNAIEQELSELQVSVRPPPCNTSGYLLDKEEIEERIGKTDSAASAICNIFKFARNLARSNKFMDRVVGVVALLGTVQTMSLSRIFAEYLGDQMLSVVCKSYEDLDLLEKYERSGSINHACGLQKVAHEMQICLNGRYHVLCLENLRPFPKVSGCNPQRKLAIPDPTLPGGSKPIGFLGYAVNMINLDLDHLCMRTRAGHGLRETLFYRLFGELQVYETREYMRRAQPCIEQGAVSLDGAIMRGHGAVSLGCWEPEILFPIATTESQAHPSPDTLELLEKIEAKKLDLIDIITEKDSVAKSLKKVFKKYHKVRDTYTRHVDTCDIS